MDVDGDDACSALKWPIYARADGAHNYSHVKAVCVHTLPKTPAHDNP